jgi:hypothetical protein
VLPVCLVVIAVPAIIITKLFVAAASQGLGAVEAIPGGCICFHIAKLL